MMVRRFTCIIYLIFFGLGCGIAMPESTFAATEAYYRFEPGGLLNDSSGNNRHLVTNSRNAVGVSLPAGFSNPIPVTGGLANTQAIAVNPDTLSTTDNGLLATASSASGDVFSSTSFTIEALIRPTAATPGATQVLVSNFDSTINERGWYLGLMNGTLRILASGNGIASNIWNGFNPLVLNNDYYVGGSLHFQPDVGPAGEDLVVRLYLRDLTNNGPLQTFQVYSTSPTTLFNPTAGLSIGSTGTTPHGTAHFPGIVDEVRYSTGVVEITDLLGYDPNAGVIAPTVIRGFYTGGPLTRLDVTLNGDQLTSYAPEDMVTATLAEYAANTQGTLRADILTPGTVLSAPASEERAGLLGDLQMNTGFIDAASWSVNFAENIVNRAGPDIVLVDFGASDSIDVTIGSTTLTGTIATTTYAGAELAGLQHWQSVESPVTTLAELQSATFVDPSIPTAGNVNMFGIDLSDFGFANGALLTAGTLVTFSGGTTIDPVEVIGLKEPQVGIPGDFDGDEDVDGRDFLLWQRNPAVGNLADWQNNYGTGGGLTAVTAVPEPSNLMLLLLGNLIGIRRHRKM
jgi:hypothetical protein